MEEIRFETPKDEIISLLNDFKEKFAQEVLKSLSDDELLSHIFLTADGNNDSLCYLTTCYEIKKSVNLLLLHKKYYWSKEPDESSATTEEYIILIILN